MEECEPFIESKCLGTAARIDAGVLERRFGIRGILAQVVEDRLPLLRKCDADKATESWIVADGQGFGR